MMISHQSLQLPPRNCSGSNGRVAALVMSDSDVRDEYLLRVEPHTWLASEPGLFPQVVELGTPFGIAAAAGRTEVHVFKGEVARRRGRQPLRAGGH